MSLRDVLAPHEGRHTSQAVARRRREGTPEIRTVRPRRTCDGPCPCHGIPSDPRRSTR